MRTVESGFGRAASYFSLLNARLGANSHKPRKHDASNTSPCSVVIEVCHGDPGPISGVLPKASSLTRELAGHIAAVYSHRLLYRGSDGPEKDAMAKISRFRVAPQLLAQRDAERRFNEPFEEHGCRHSPING